MSQHGRGCTIVRLTPTNQRATSFGADSSSFKFENMLMQQASKQASNLFANKNRFTNH